MGRCAVPGSATETPPLQTPTAHAGEGDLPQPTGDPLRGPSVTPLSNWKDPRWPLDPLHHPPRPRPPLPVRVRKPAGPTSASFYWGRFLALAALAVVFCSLHTMPARHGGPRVHSNNVSRGAGRACSRLGHCGPLRARRACFAPEPRFPKSLHHSSLGGGMGIRAFR